jgi:hypothetical protein
MNVSTTLKLWCVAGWCVCVFRVQVGVQVGEVGEVGCEVCVKVRVQILILTF